MLRWRKHYCVNKYWHVCGVGIKNILPYRVNFLSRTLFGFIPLLAVVYLWRKIFEGKDADATVSTFTLAEMTSYYLIVTIADALTARGWNLQQTSLGEVSGIQAIRVRSDGTLEGGADPRREGTVGGIAPQQAPTPNSSRASR